MRVRGLTNLATAGLLLLQIGCAEKLQRGGFDRVSAGVTVRQLKGDHLGFRAKTTFPVAEIRATRKLTDNLDLSIRGQFTSGEVEAGHRTAREVLHGQGQGNFEGLGLILTYFPLKTRFIGGEIGIEAYRAEYDMRGWSGRRLVKQTIADRFWGGGVNLGLTGEIPLDQKERWHFVWGGGYLFTATDARKANVDLDGWYGTAAIQVSLSRK